MYLLCDKKNLVKEVVSQLNQESFIPRETNYSPQEIHPSIQCILTYATIVTVCWFYLRWGLHFHSGCWSAWAACTHSPDPWCLRKTAGQIIKPNNLINRSWWAHLRKIKCTNFQKLTHWILITMRKKNLWAKYFHLLSFFSHDWTNKEQRINVNNESVSNNIQ